METFYKAKDGTVFEDRLECMRYENGSRDKIQKAYDCLNEYCDTRSCNNCVLNIDEHDNCLAAKLHAVLIKM